MLPFRVGTRKQGQLILNKGRGIEHFVRKRFLEAGLRRVESRDLFLPVSGAISDFLQKKKKTVLANLTLVLGAKTEMCRKF